MRCVAACAWMVGALLGIGAAVAQAETVGSNPSMDQFLPEWRPYGGTLRFALHGDYQIFEVGKVRDAAQTGLLRLQNTLTFEPDVQLTDTFRLHARWRPLNNEAFFFDGTQGRPDRVQRAFFEGKAVGLDVAGGRLPLEFHNLYMAQDDVLGGLIAKNNISVFGLPNIRAMAFGTASGRFHELEGRAGRQVGLYGFDAVIDTMRYITEATVGFLHDEDRAKQNERHAGLSVTRIQPRQSTSLRAFGNWNEANAGAGGLFIMEHSYVFPAEYLERPTWYANAFYGTRDYRSMAAGSLKNLGFLFNQLNLAPQLNNFGIDSFGFATGLLLGRSRDFTVTPEFAMVFDQSRLNNDQMAGGIRTQTRLMDTSFLRVDLTSFHQSIDRNRSQYAASALVVYKF
ncbi:MAG: hypothetical protein Q7R68_02790 [Nitrospirales bacterium]|nr:hypothetical protein [Nitrospirales bacterium]